jgi:hypothetical protein
MPVLTTPKESQIIKNLVPKKPRRAKVKKIPVFTLKNDSFR